MALAERIVAIEQRIKEHGLAIAELLVNAERTKTVHEPDSEGGKIGALTKGG